LGCRFNDGSKLFGGVVAAVLILLIEIKLYLFLFGLLKNVLEISKLFRIWPLEVAII
jgi:hypothetical protein